MKIVTIVGARPQFIKAAALSRVIQRDRNIQEVIIHTGQHFDDNMSKVFFDELEIPEPQYHLDIHSLGHGAMTGRMLEAIENILLIEKPDFVLIYGDTNSTLAGALAAKKLHIRVAHVEAGLRSFNMQMPEEINRILSDRISDILFCPTQQAVANLRNEGYDHLDATVCNSGDIMYDAALFFRSKSGTNTRILTKYHLTPGDYILGTIHRQENTDDIPRLMQIVAAFNHLHAERQVIVPLHPRTRNIMKNQGIQPEFTVIEPIGYIDMTTLTSNAGMVMTDSGGLQKEAYFFGKYCLTLRDQTEWTELVENGFNTIVGADKDTILDAYYTNRTNTPDFSTNLYGDGHAAEFISAKLLTYLG